MLNNVIDRRTAQKIWELFPPFARYGFNRSHGTCYALIGYQTAYLKAHYPVEFMTALLNADEADIDRVAFLVNECRKMKIEVLAPDINQSLAGFTADVGGQTIRFGLLAVKNVGKGVVEAIVSQRQQVGQFGDWADFLQRIEHKDLNKKSLESLIKCGALDSLRLERGQALANIDEFLKFSAALRRARNDNQIGLFGQNIGNASLRLHPPAGGPATATEKLTWEKELLGLYLSDHPLNGYRQKISNIKAAPLIDALKMRSEANLVVAGLVAKIQRIMTRTGKPMLFVRLEDFTDGLEVVVFPDTLEKTMAAWREGAVVGVAGRLSLRDGEAKLICNNAREL